MPKVNFIITTYNRGRIVKETISPVLPQTKPDLEFVVVDDGSDDDTCKII